MALDMSLESRNIHLNLGIDDYGGCSWPDRGGCLRKEKEKYALRRMNSPVWEAAMKDAELAANSTASTTTAPTSAATSCFDGDGIWSS